MEQISRLNLLLTQPPVQRDALGPPDWPQVVSMLLTPLQVRTFVAHDGSEAITLVQRHVMHVAVLDARISDDKNSGMDSMTVLRLIQCLHRGIQDEKLTGRLAPERHASDAWRTGEIENDPALGRRIPVTGPEKSQDGWNQTPGNRPLVILLAAQRSDQLMREALRQNVFCVLPTPVDLNALLDAMARAMKRFYGNHWPQ
jgi:CheY-like chemotaxis protein